ncbi:hypothetical protein EOM86_13645, partial [Candidatus Nomurabacteria bacterium]|nr:hypothetical protein [Candidatus Nomurabacteria bacterium]
MPEFRDWEAWALKHGFDQDTLDWIYQDTETRWHNLDKEKLQSEHETAFATPRTWEYAMWILKDYVDCHNLKSIKDIPEEKLIKLIQGTISIDVAEQYAYFLNTKNNETVSFKKLIKHIMEEGKYDANDPEINKALGLQASEIFDGLKTGIIATYKYGQYPRGQEFDNLISFFVETLPTKGDYGNLIFDFIEDWFLNEFNVDTDDDTNMEALNFGENLNRLAKAYP